MPSIQHGVQRMATEQFCLVLLHTKSSKPDMAVMLSTSLLVAAIFQGLLTCIWDRAEPRGDKGLEKDSADIRGRKEMGVSEGWCEGPREVEGLQKALSLARTRWM